mgnify:CR=1 FL=1
MREFVKRIIIIKTMKKTLHRADGYAILASGKERAPMSVAKYQVFLKTVECGSFTAAAREMNFTQSGVSHAIGSLEEELGVPLLIRSHGGVTPTADGRALLPYFEKMCAMQHQLEQQAADLRGLEIYSTKLIIFI